MTLTLAFTEQDAERLARLLDIAVKAGGLAVAQDALDILAKMQAAAKAAQKEE